MEILFFLGVIWAVYAWINRSSNESEKPLGRSANQAKSYSDENNPARSSRGDSDLEHGESSLSLIRRAIEKGCNLSFQYIDQDGEITVRIVTPHHIERRHGAGILCLIAYCYLRNSNRTFVIHRMNKVSIK